ncbi:thiamine diphosphokinase, partial [Bacillus pumilus]
DRGALFLIENNYKPDLAVGDFDSISPADLLKVRSGSKQLIDCDPIDKDLTDTELALDLAIKEQPDIILLMGVTGSRLDHTLANIQMMNRVL